MRIASRVMRFAQLTASYSTSFVTEVSLVGWVACCLATQLFGASMCWVNDKAINPTYPTTALEND